LRIELKRKDYINTNAIDVGWKRSIAIGLILYISKYIFRIEKLIR